MQKISKAFMILCFSFLLGIWVEGENWPMYIGFFILIALFLIIRKKYLLIMIIPCVLSLLGGRMYLEKSYPEITPERIEYYENQFVDFEGVISEEPDERIMATKLTVEARRIWIENKEKEVGGKVLISTGLYPKRTMGDVLRISCKIQKPEPIEDFAYNKYLSRYHIYAVCYRADIKVIGEEYGLKQQILLWKSILLQEINKKLPEPHAALMNGILIGARQGIPDEVAESFNIVGITHIIAISGYNITIIASIVMKIMTRYFMRRQYALTIVLVVLGVFVIMTGMQASVVRAAIMGSIALFSQTLGRIGKVGNILIVSATIMSLINPKILVFDAGFQLSFLATIGLIYISPYLERVFKRIPDILEMRTSLIGTLSATVPTLPIIIFQFKRISLIAPIVNVLVLPTIPPIMFLGVIILICNGISEKLSLLPTWTAWLLLEYVVEISHWFSGIPFAAIGV